MIYNRKMYVFFCTHKDKDEVKTKTPKKKKGENHHSTAAVSEDAPGPPRAVNFSSHFVRPASLSTSLPAARSRSAAGCTRHNTSSVRDT